MDLTGFVGKLDRKAQHIETPVLGMLDRQAHLLMLRLRVVKDLTDIEYPTTGHPSLVEFFNPVRDGFLPNLFVERGIDRLAIGKAQSIVGKLGALPQVFELERYQQLVIERIVTRRDRDPAPSEASNNP